MAVPLLVPQQVPIAIAPQPASKPGVEVTLTGSSAGFNGNIIANTPGRQPTDSYAVFRNEATGEVVYRGTLPGFRTVSNEVADILSWHPHDSRLHYFN
ncbi:hypothetical protein [Polynucleobacter necessarius]|uniref:hypothetical protein n=1 Tax=Polynucleobacter necessarius TaxID=576610 RepID=UPI000E094619|nr:hypothetical protein [Polynucleobacter necessarius]HAT39997.1 hypothetical protein [Polynucleobacter sp.]